MGKRPNRSYDKDGKDNNKIRSLQQELKEKNKRIKQLESEVRTLNKAFEKSAAYMSKESAPVSVEQLISAANKSETLEEAKRASEQTKKNVPAKAKICPPSEEEIKKKRDETREKMKAWREKEYGKYEEE